MSSVMRLALLVGPTRVSSDFLTVVFLLMVSTGGSAGALDALTSPLSPLMLARMSPEVDGYRSGSWSCDILLIGLAGEGFHRSSPHEVPLAD